MRLCVRETQEELRLHRFRKGDLWALCRGAAERGGCGFSGSTQSQVLETLTGLRCAT